MQIINNNKGFGIIQVLVAVGIGSILMLGVTQQQINSQHQAVELSKKLFEDNTMRYLESYLSEFCTETFKTKTKAVANNEATFTENAQLTFLIATLFQSQVQD